MKVIITESKLINVIHKYLNMSYEGFDDCYYNWADFNCGMGVCCDIYAVGFTLPDGEIDDYVFKYVDGENYDDDGDYPEELRGELPEICHHYPNIQDEKFDTILISGPLYERLEDMFGHISVWRDSLMSLMNKTFNINARHLMYMYETIFSVKL